MKQILFASYSLEMGGIEKALINLLDNFDYDNYNVDLLLQNTSNNYFSVNKNVNILKYEISSNKNVLSRKISNRLKIIKYLILNYHKYNASICYATYDTPSSIITRYASKNNILWVHSDYYYLLNKNISKFKKFFNKRKAHRFRKIVFVSNEAKNNFINIYPKLENKCEVINNIIDADEIITKSKEKIKTNNDKYNLVYVGRLEEKSKRITRLLNVLYKLKKNKQNVLLNIIGDGNDYHEYKRIIKRLELDDCVYLLGNKKNPYPYIKKSDALILTSDYEGFPVVYLEALVLNKPIITTINVSSGTLNISDYASICEKNEDDIMKKIIKLKETNKVFEKFDVLKYNNENLNKIKKIVGEYND